jgi:hypothetical protein
MREQDNILLLMGAIELYIITGFDYSLGQSEWDKIFQRHERPVTQEEIKVERASIRDYQEMQRLYANQ